MAATLDRDRDLIPSVPFPEWWEGFRRAWLQGEHVALVGPTGQGKTTLALRLADCRKWTVLVATKPRDRTTAGLARKGWQIIRQWPPNAGQRRVVFWRPIKKLGGKHEADSAAVENALQAVYEAGAWTVILDDLQGLLLTLRLGRIVDVLLLNARSMDLTVVSSTQRPRWVPREVWTQSTHLIIWGTGDRDDLRSLSGLGVANKDAIQATVAQLAKHEFVYVNTRTGQLARSKMERG